MEKRRIVATPRLGFTVAIKNVLSNLTNVKGRARRSEYWWYVLATTIISMICSQILGTMPLIITLVSIILTLSMVAVAARRVHDSGKSAVWVYIDYTFSIIVLLYLYTSGFYDKQNVINPNPNDIIDIMSSPIFWGSALISSVTGIVVFIFSLFDSDVAANKYGESPKYVAEETQEEVQ